MYTNYSKLKQHNKFKHALTTVLIMLSVALLSGGKVTVSLLMKFRQESSDLQQLFGTVPAAKPPNSE